jgi:hypothetical protein
VKPIATLLLRGEATVLREAEQNVLSRWVLMKFIVIEQQADGNDRIPVLTTQVEREAFRNGIVENDWRVWISNQNSLARSRSFVRHVLPKSHTAPKPLDFHILNDRIEQTQFFVWRLRHLVVTGSFTRMSNLEINAGSPTERRQIYPRTSSVRWPPLSCIGQTELSRLESNASGFLKFDNPNWQV